jgi:hypothetical protein
MNTLGRLVATSPITVSLQGGDRDIRRIDDDRQPFYHCSGTAAD